MYWWLVRCGMSTFIGANVRLCVANVRLVHLFAKTGQGGHIVRFSRPESAYGQHVLRAFSASVAHCCDLYPPLCLQALKNSADLPFTQRSVAGYGRLCRPAEPLIVRVVREREQHEFGAGFQSQSEYIGHDLNAHRQPLVQIVNCGRYLLNELWLRDTGCFTIPTRASSAPSRARVSDACGASRDGLGRST